MAGGEEPVSDLQEHRPEDLRQQQRAARLVVGGADVRSTNCKIILLIHNTALFWPKGFCIHLQFD